MAILGGLAGIVVVILVLIIVNAPGDNIGIAVTITDVPPTDSTSPAVAANITDTPDTAQPEATQSDTSTAALVGDFDTPTVIPTDSPVTASATPITPTSPPTGTNTPEPTPTATNTPTITPTATATDTPTATLPPAGLQGRQDLLELIQRVDSDAAPWEPEHFSISADNAYWRLGVGSPTEGDMIFIDLAPALLETYYGNNAASRIWRMEATLTLTTFNPPLLLDKEVYFGMLLRDAADPDSTAGLQVQLVQAGVINLAQRTGDDVRTISQLSVNAATVRVRLERNLDTGAITIFVNDQQLGQPITLAPADAPLVPALFVKDGGVIVSVTDWRITLR